MPVEKKATAGGQLSADERKVLEAISRRNPADVGRLARSQGLMAMWVGIAGFVLSMFRLELIGAGGSAVLALAGFMELERSRLMRIIAYLAHREATGGAVGLTRDGGDPDGDVKKQGDVKM